MTCEVPHSGPRETMSLAMEVPWPTWEALVPREKGSGDSDGGFRGCCPRSRAPPRL